MEDKKLIEKIVLNGKVGMVDTGDATGETIGIIHITYTSTFSGDVIVKEIKHFPFSKEMEKRIGWKHKFASVRFYTSDSVIDSTKVEENFIKSYYGEVAAEYNLRYSDYTGYLWTDEEFRVGGHDLLNILRSFYNKFIHIEIELYE